MPDAIKYILCLVAAGAGGLDERRARLLGSALDADVTYYFVDKAISRGVAMWRINELLRSRNWDLVYQEGTGIASGLSLIGAAHKRRQPYLVSVGDPIGGFFQVTEGPLHGQFFGFYERLLYRYCTGIVGWTPYLTGRALQMGARRAATVEGGADLSLFTPASPADKQAARRKLGLASTHLVCGVVGSLRWNRRQSYSYGLELVETLKRVRRSDVSILIVGDGDGLEYLKQRVPDALRSRIVFTGRLPQEEVVTAMQAMDIGFITQTLDALGNYRLTTKMPEYLSCGLPVAMSPVPGFYDYVALAGWALTARHPADAEFHKHCAAWLDRLDREEVAEKARQARSIACQRFDYEILSKRFRLFVEDLLATS